jgi:hypothetical protein
MTKKDKISSLALALKLIGLLVNIAWIIIIVVNKVDNFVVTVFPLYVGSFVFVYGYLHTKNFGKYRYLALVVGAALVALISYFAFVILSIVNFVR